MSDGSAVPLNSQVIFIYLTLLCVAVLLITWSRASIPTGSKNPPGPHGWPIIGNILNLSLKGSWNSLTAFRKIYGDLVFFHGLGNNILVLNSLDTMNDLLDKRGQLYSDRPFFTMASELMGADQTMIFKSYCEEWREQRKIVRGALSPSSVKKYHPMLKDFAVHMCGDIIERPLDFCSSVRLTAGKIVIGFTYGIRIESAEDEYITDEEEVTERVGRAAVPGTYLCDFVPMMKYLPEWVPFRKEARAVRELAERCASRPFETVLRNMSQGIATTSLVKDILTTGKTESKHLNGVKWAAGSLYAAGTETTYASVLTFIMAMALHPKQQQLAHDEIDRVVGPGRLPQFEDRENLPYLNAIIKETARWHPVVPLSVARRTLADDWYKGFHIPKGTIIVPNLWAVAFSENVRYDPQAFIPERFLDEGSLEINPATWQFGFGRRICPGKALAEESVFILIAHLIWTFSFAVDESEGLAPEFTEDLVSYPKPFKCLISPRSERHHAGVQDALAGDDNWFLS
ncbi:hypothetical protein CVT26_002956 [Gymnopilus dilepis]|uniref:Cytochrome P450 n=1 Tax=Gymnopilus dilepis TaxID=231916 RepID=A0A409VQW3_9AGAR|nr:hypothetical protein CVT26_002956 [Gymnopilus dilepis]